MGPVAYQEGLAVQEPALQPAHLHGARAKPADEPLSGGVGLQRESEHVPLGGEVALVVG